MFLHLSILCSFAVFPLYAGISLRGTVVDQNNAPLANILVSLAKNGLSDTTDTSGTFRLISIVSATLPTHLSRVSQSFMLIRSNAIILENAGNEKASLSLYTLQGARILFAERLPGFQSPLSLPTNQLAQATYVIKVIRGSKSTVLKYNHYSHGSSFRYNFDDGIAAVLKKTTASADSVVDSLIVQNGVQRTSIPLTSLIDSTISIKIENDIPVRLIESTLAGGLWYDTKTWKGGIIPNATNDVVINGQVYAGVLGTDTSACRNITIAPTGILRAEAYNARTLFVHGNLVNKGDVRNGPDAASYDNATFSVRLWGNLVQDSIYRPSATYFTGDSAQSISVGAHDYLAGAFFDTKPASPIKAISDIVFRSFSLSFDTTSTLGVLDMQNYTFHLASGAFALSAGTLKTSVIVCDSFTSFTCPRIRSTTGPTTIKGILQTANSQFDSSVVIDSGAVFYNQGYTDAVVTVKGNFTNKGLTRRGPGFAAYGEGNLAMILEKDFRQAGTYAVQLTRFTSATTHTITVDSGSTLQGSFFNDLASADIVAGSAISFRDFSLDFGTTNGRLVMGNSIPRIVGGAFVLKGGTLETSVIQADSLTTFTCKNVSSASGTVLLKGSICTDTTVFAANVIVDSNAIFYNKGYTEAVVTVKGNFTNNGLTRRGPGFAAYGEGNLALLIEKNFRQNGTYVVQLTRFTGTTQQTIGTDSGKVLQGLFYDDTPQSGLLATTSLIINEAKFVLSPDTVNKGTFSMDTFRLFHLTGNFQIDSGSLQVDSITGGADGNTVFTVPKITTKNGTVTINKHYRTTSCAITGALIVDNNGVFYNQGYISAYVTTTAAPIIRGTIGSGPGFASYGDGQLFLNGTLLAVWR